MLSASKIFSYAGQRIALCCISDALYGKYYPALAQRYGDAGVFGSTLTASILYMMTSGCTSSTQYAYAQMLNLSCEGVIDFIEDTRDYERRALRMKEIFCRHGFNVVYDKDVDEKVISKSFESFFGEKFHCQNVDNASLFLGRESDLDRRKMSFIIRKKESLSNQKLVHFFADFFSIQILVTI